MSGPVTTAIGANLVVVIVIFISAALITNASVIAAAFDRYF